MRTQEEMEAAFARMLEIQRDEAKTHCEATAVFGGPLIPANNLHSRGPDTHWQRAPADWDAARRYSLWAALDLLSVAPGPYDSRQWAMMSEGETILLDQIRTIIGQKAFKKLQYTPDLMAMIKFWQTIIGFAEPHVTYDWIERHRSKVSMGEEVERRTKYEAAEARKAQRKPGKAKRGKAVRR